MRSSKSRSRTKNRGPNRSPANNLNRVFDSSGPEGKVRGTPQQIIDKYAQLARDAFLGNDRVAAENFQQHAEHYTRLLAEAQRDADEKRLQTDQQNRDRQQQQNRPRDRDDRDRDGDGDPAQPEGVDPGAAPQPDVVDFGAPHDEDSGLVETPEEQPKRKPARARKPRAPKVARAGDGGDGGASAGPSDTAEAAAS